MNKDLHNRELLWKVLLITLGIISLSSGFIKSPGFWTSYALDIAGPAWIYLLLRGQYNLEKSAFLSIKFTANQAISLVIGIGFIIEIMQYYKIYEAHYDPYDFIAYVSLSIPVYLLDKWLIRRQNKENVSHL